MSYKITNTALDYSKRFLHRKASKMQMEPVLAGRRLRIRTSMVISDELFEHNKANLELWKRWGVVDWEQVGGEKSKKESKAAAPASRPESAPGEFRVWLDQAGDDKITLIKTLREVFSLSIKDADVAIASAPVVIAEGLSEEAANGFAATIAATGSGTHISKKEASSLLPTLTPENMTPPPPPLQESPPAETTSVEIKPQPKNPSKGKQK